MYNILQEENQARRRLFNERSGGSRSLEYSNPSERSFHSAIEAAFLSSSRDTNSVGYCSMAREMCAYFQSGSFNEPKRARITGDPNTIKEFHN